MLVKTKLCCQWQHYNKMQHEQLLLFWTFITGPSVSFTWSSIWPSLAAFCLAPQQWWAWFPCPWVETRVACLSCQWWRCYWFVWQTGGLCYLSHERCQMSLKHTNTKISVTAKSQTLIIQTLLWFHFIYEHLQEHKKKLYFIETGSVYSMFPSKHWPISKFKLKYAAICDFL